MENDIENGARLLLDEVDEILKAKIPPKERLQWRIHKYMLESAISSRRKVRELDDKFAEQATHWFYFPKRNPKAFWMAAGFLLLMITPELRVPLGRFLTDNNIWLGYLLRW